MARSLAKIHEQIAKLQKEADSIQGSVISRIKKEIAQHGLTAEHLFGSSGATAGRGSTPKTAARTAAKSKNAASKPAKYADGQGNAWHGIGKRPQWIHEALDAGRELEDFLVNSVKSAFKAKAPTKAAPAAKKAAVEKAAMKKVAAKKPQAEASVVAKPAAKAPAKKAATPKQTVKRAPAKKTKAPQAAEPAQTAA